jgi:hypothetical protein
VRSGACLLLAACVSCSANGPARGNPAYERALAALCSAREEAARDPVAARATFFDRAHDPLHTLARQVGDGDRAQAGRLLRAKTAVEANLERRRTASSLLPDFDHLIRVTREALREVGEPAPPCPSRAAASPGRPS